MTKKSYEILNLLEKKFELYIYLFESTGFHNLTKCQKNLLEETERCSEMVSNMFHFGLLNENDFHGLCLEISCSHDKYMKRANWLYANKC